jgi:hypothetical protein
VYDHLRTWTNHPTDSVSMRLDLWDTGRTRDGKSELRYALWICDGDLTQFGNSALFEGEEFWPSPMDAIDSDHTAAALLSFMAADGESIAYGDEERAERYTPKQRELLTGTRELISLWELELDGELDAES